VVASPSRLDELVALSHPCHDVLYKLVEELAVVVCPTRLDELVALNHPCHAVSSSSSTDEWAALNQSSTPTNTSKPVHQRTPKFHEA